MPIRSSMRHVTFIPEFVSRKPDDRHAQRSSSVLRARFHRRIHRSMFIIVRAIVINSDCTGSRRSFRSRLVRVVHPLLWLLLPSLFFAILKRECQLARAGDWETRTVLLVIVRGSTWRDGRGWRGVRSSNLPIAAMKTEPVGRDGCDRRRNQVLWRHKSTVRLRSDFEARHHVQKPACTFFFLKNEFLSPWG